MNPMMKLFLSAHVALYRASKGKLGGAMDGGKVLLLTTKGNKSGKERTVPLMYFEHDGERAIIASAAGAPSQPAWFKNLKATPEVTAQVGGERYGARAEIVTGDKRAEIWKRVVAQMPRFAGYEKKAQGREIPVVVLRRG